MAYVLGGKGKCVPGREVQTFFPSYKISFITISFYWEHEKDFGGGTDFWLHPSTSTVVRAASVVSAGETIATTENTAFELIAHLYPVHKQRGAKSYPRD